MIELYEHNQTAYDSAAAMLAQVGKAAVIHPTGTGKSFIGFKLCEEKAGAKVCWLSPSEYIFRTQLENLKAVTGGEAPDNIQFLTYARLMLMEEEELREIQPDYIILDEYHRAGAPFWQKGVEHLLECYPNTPVLGLSATNVRYLDNQRDMAEELFGGQIASEMTLGDAIVRGILNPPKYVLSMFQYQKSLLKYERRIQKTRSKPVRDEAEKYLEKLRRALEKADGLEEIFAKHMSEPHGKYIVFCANKEHMDEMIGHLEWFAKVDKEPRIYSVYSSDPEAEKAFRQFKEDAKSDHLRLLYCIDALNEGIHVEDIDGVILLRPTVSPIIYKQQIGRALSASKRTNPIIFDIVLNIENLYSIGAIEEEMELATAYYRSLGETDAIVNERFQIIDEVRDCRSLFEKLNNTLTATWEMYYACAKAYFEENGNLEIPARFVTAEGYALGSWLFNQKAIRNGKLAGKLNAEQIKKLDEIGMVWELYSDLSWSKNLEAAKAYHKKNGNLEITARYVTEDGFALGAWLNTVRTWRKSGQHPNYLTEERIRELDALGMIWSVLDYQWERNYAAAEAYYREHGNLEVSSRYQSEDGVQLGSWLSRQRGLRNGTDKGIPLTEKQIVRLEAIGMVWDARTESKWNHAYEAAEEYVATHGDFLIPATYRTEAGFQLGSWVQRQRRAFRKGTLTKEREVRLNRIGMIWEAERRTAVGD